jgi:hypothetical protein
LAIKDLRKLKVKKYFFINTDSPELIIIIRKKACITVEKERFYGQMNYNLVFKLKAAKRFCVFAAFKNFNNYVN